ncbi:MAG: helix-turn-helix transcriptional regulator [Subdoligranulum sp.]|nr:helix-turn-helix transcriptional regulator [Subdoligranulum sp.]
MISFKPFRELIAERKITTYYLRNKCGRYNLDSKTIDRLMKDESVSTNTVDALCQIFSCDVTDIMQVLPDPESDTLKNT